MSLCENSSSISLINDIDELLNTSRKCFEKIKSIKDESSIHPKDAIFMPKVNIGSEYEELIEFAKNVRKEVLFDTDTTPPESCKEFLGKDNPWETKVPPIWDQYVLDDYVKGILNVYFTREPRQNTVASSNQYKKTYKDKSTFVEEDEMQSRENLYEINNQVEKYETHRLKNVTEPLSYESVPQKSKVMPVSYRPKVFIERKRPLTSRSVDTYTTKSSINQNIRSVSAPLLRKPQNKLAKMQHKTSSLPKCLRFVGNALTTPVNFNKEHPDIFLEESTDTLFPRRCQKVTETQHPDEKLSKSKENITADLKNNKLPKKDNILEKSTISPPSTGIDRTWHEVLLVEKFKMNEPRRMLENASTSSSSEGTPASGNIDKDDAYAMDTRAENVLEKETKNFKDVIYDSVTIKQIPKVDNMKNYQIQNLPILCIRGEECKVQRGIDISIVDIKDNKTSGDGSENDGQSNVKFFEFMYDPKEHVKTFSNKILTDTDRQITPKNLPESIAQEYDNLSLQEREAEELNKTKEFKDKSECGSRMNLKKINKFMAPFFIQDSKPTPHTGTSENENNYETSFEESSSLSLSTDVTLSHENSFQTDDEKIKSKQFETKKHPTISSSTEKIEIPDPKSIPSSNIENKIVNKNSSDNGTHLILEESTEFLEVHKTDILNIFEEVFSCSTDFEMNENTKLNPEDVQKENETETFSKPKKFVSVGIDCARDDFNYLENAKDKSIQTENIQPSKDQVVEKNASCSFQQINEEQEKESLSNMLNKIRLDNQAILDRLNTTRRQASVSTSTRPDIFVDDNGMITPFEHQVPINSNPSKRVTINNVEGDSNQHRMYMKPIKLDSGQPNIGKETVGCAIEQDAVNTNIDAINDFRNNVDVHDESDDDDDIDYNYGTFYRQADDYMNVDGRTSFNGDEVENRFNLTDKRKCCSAKHYSSALLGQSNEYCKCKLHPTSYLNDFYRTRYKSLSMDSIYDDDDDDISKILDTPLEKNQSFYHSNKYPEKYHFNRLNYKKFQKTVLEQSPRFSKTINRIYSDSGKTIPISSKRSDPKVQRAAKKFLKSLNNDTNYYKSKKKTVNKNFDESSSLSQYDNFYLESLSSSDWEFSSMFPKAEVPTRKTNNMPVPTTVTTTTATTTATATGSGFPLTLSSTASDISIPKRNSLAFQQSKGVFLIDPIQTVEETFSLENDKKRSISPSQSQYQSSSSGQCSTIPPFNRNELVRIGSMSEGEVLSLGEIKNFSDEEDDI